MAFNWKRLVEGILTGGLSELGNLSTGSSSISEQWDKFKNGTTNETNLKQTENTNATNKEINEETNLANQQITEMTNRANYDIAQATNRANYDIAQDTNKSNESIADKTNQMNYQVAQENLNFQREQQAYEEALQQQIFEREDTAYQRTVEDMQKAGISPLAMQGTNGSGSVVSRTPLQNNMQYQGYTAQGSTNIAPIMESAKMSPYSVIPFTMQSSGLADALPILQSFIDLAKGNEQKDATIENIKADTDAKRMENLFKYTDLSEEQKQKIIKTQLDQLDLNEKTWNFDMQQQADTFMQNIGILPKLPKDIQNFGFLTGGNMFTRNDKQFDYYFENNDNEKFFFKPTEDFQQKMQANFFWNAIKSGLGILGAFN